jgi:inorganic pyrophosphatase
MGSPSGDPREVPEGACVEVVVEVPRWGFVKRSGKGRVEFVSPFPCPFNYGSVPALAGRDGDPVDAAVLGARLPRGMRVSTTVRGVVGFVDLGTRDDKLICAARPLSRSARNAIVLFFRFYALCKRMCGAWRGQRGGTACRGWVASAAALPGEKPFAGRSKVALPSANRTGR